MFNNNKSKDGKKHRVVKCSTEIEGEVSEISETDVNSVYQALGGDILKSELYKDLNAICYAI